MGVAPGGVDGGSPVKAVRVVASAMADATGTFVSSRQPAGTHPCFVGSGSTRPDPAGSRCTTHHPRALDVMMNVSPLRRFQMLDSGSGVEIHLHNNIKLILLLGHVRIYGYRI